MMQKTINRHVRRKVFHELRRAWRAENGQAAIEFVLVVPFLILLLLGSVELFNMSQASRKLTLATATVGDLVTQAGGTLRKSDIDGYYQASKPIMGQFDTAYLRMSVYTFTLDSKGRPQLSWQYHLGNGKCGQTPALTDDQKQSMQDGNDLVITRGCYDYTLTLGRAVLGSTQMQLREEVVFRPRNTLKVYCSDCS